MTEDIRVSYGVKELLGQINTRLESIDTKLDAKADMHTVLDLARRIQLLEDRASQQTAIDRAFNQRSSSQFSKREKVITAATAAAVLAMTIHPIHF